MIARAPRRGGLEAQGPTRSYGSGVLLVLVVTAVSAALAVRRGGSLTNLASTTFEWVGVLIAALVLQVAADLLAPDDISSTGLLIVTYLVVAAFVLRNRKLPGLLIAVAGLAMNILVISLNGAMPVSRWAADIAGVESVSNEMGIKHEIAGSETDLAFLGDVIPLPETRRVISAGDVVLAAGIAVLVYRRTLYEPKAVRRASG